MSAIVNQKFNQLYLQGYQPLQNCPGDCSEGPHQDTGAWGSCPIQRPLPAGSSWRDQCFAPIPDPQPLPSSLLKKQWGNDRTIMSPFRESAKTAAPPLKKFPCSKSAPPLPETTAPVLTSLPSPFYKSHCSPRLRAAPSFPQPAWQFGPALNFPLWTWDFSHELSLRAAFFLTLLPKIPFICAFFPESKYP
jgi:hypothetical protein